MLGECLGLFVEGVFLSFVGCLAFCICLGL